MGVRESHPFAGQTVEIRCRDFGGRVVAAGITVAEVVREDVDDVRLGRIGGKSRSGEQNRRDGQHGEGE
jgi:hypothetical protein